MAGIAGPTLISFFYKQTGTYASVLIFFAVLFIPNLIIAIQLKGKGFEQKEVPASTPWKQNEGMKKQP